MEEKVCLLELLNWKMINGKPKSEIYRKGMLGPWKNYLDGCRGRTMEEVWSLECMYWKMRNGLQQWGRKS